MSSSDAELDGFTAVTTSPELPFAEPLLASANECSEVPSGKIGNLALRLHESIDPLDEWVEIPYNRKSHGFRLFIVEPDSIVQFSLPFEYNSRRLLDSNVAQFGEFLPRSRLPLVKGTFWSLVAREPRLRQLAETLYQMGKPLIGDVIQMTPAELARDASATPNEIDLLTGLLATADLHLGVRVADWRSVRHGAGR